ncbi:MAG TPA: CHAT domain-containing protein [Pyrinomonadaceae bacterium]|nr:CHAT domain-containing protein [Pyrinomonadaceae bacterium]
MNNSRASSPILSLCFLLLSASLLFGQSDQLRLEAERSQAEGEELFNKNTPEDRERAFPKFVEAAALWEKVGDDERLIATLNKLNDISYFRSDFKQCIFYSSKLLPLSQKIGNRNLEGGVLGNLGLYHHILGESRKGLGFLERSAEILGEIGEKQRQSITLSNIGQVYYYLGDVKTSIDNFYRSLELKRETGDRKGEGITLNNLGFVFNEGGEKRRSLEYYEQALAIAVETEDRSTEATLQSNIGFIYQDWGEFQKAFEYYLRSLEIRRKIGDVRGQAVSMQNIAALYRTLGDYENSRRSVEQALEIYQKGGFRREEALALSSLGSLYMLIGDKKRALEHDLKAFEIQQSLDNKSGFSFILQNIGKIYLEDNENNAARGYFEQALKYAEESNDVVSAAQNLVLLARSYEKTDQAQAAEASFVRAISIFTELQMPFELANALYYFARFDENQGRSEAALDKIRKVLEIVEDLRNSISSQHLQTGFFAEQQKFYDFYISLLAAQHKRYPDKGYGALAFELSERARARSLLDTLGEIRRDIRTTVSQDLLEEESILRSTINAKDRQRIDALKQKAGEKASELEKEIAGYLRSYQELEARIRKENSNYASLSKPEPLSLSNIRSQVLNEDTVLLEYFLGEERSFLFLVTKDTLEIVELPKRETIEAAVRAAVENIKARSLDLANETAAQRALRLRKADALAEADLQDLGKTLISPVSGRIRGKRLLIVASGILQYLPFAAIRVPRPIDGDQTRLPRPRGSTGGSPGARTSFLVETNEIVYLPSASVVPILRKIRSSRDSSAKNMVSILADPVFAADDPRNTKFFADETAASIMRDPKVLLPNLRSDFSRLRFSRSEAEAISQLGLSDQRFVALDFAANLTSATGEEVQSSRIVHFATHGIVNSQFPSLSSLVFSLVDETGKEQDGHLRLHDVYSLRLNADLVVLSACETALGKEIRGEGIVGLTRGFMYAGAPSVMASLWRVEDRATADLMKRFYQRMFREDLLPSAALRQSQISMLKERNTAPPFFWAGFTLQGDWR